MRPGSRVVARTYRTLNVASAKEAWRFELDMIEGTVEDVLEDLAVVNFDGPRLEGSARGCSLVTPINTLLELPDE